MNSRNIYFRTAESIIDFIFITFSLLTICGDITDFDAW